MDGIALGKKQTKEMAQTIYGDIKSYCQNNFDRYFLFFLNETRKAKGKPPFKQRIVMSSLLPCCNDCFLSDKMRGASLKHSPEGMP